MQSTTGLQTTQELARYYYPMVYRLALSYTRRVSAAEDVAQDVFLRLLRAAPVFTSEEQQKAWLLRVTINCCKSSLSSYWHRNVSTLPDDELARQVDVQRAAPSAEDEVLAGERSALVLSAVSRLPWKQRVCVHLFYYEDLPLQSIAHITGMKESTVKSHLHRGRETLRTTLKGVCDEF